MTKTCCWLGCDRPADRRDLCTRHYDRARVLVRDEGARWTDDPRVWATLWEDRAARVKRERHETGLRNLQAAANSVEASQAATQRTPAPQQSSAPETPDRSGWPVLVRDGDDYRWPDDSWAIVRCLDGAFNAWHCGGFSPGGNHPTASAAADAIRARLPDESEAAQTAPQPAPDPLIAAVDAREEWKRRAEEAEREAADLRAARDEWKARAESAEATRDAYRIQRDRAREDAAGVRRLLSDAADLRAAAAEACDCEDGEVPSDAELARRLRELAREPQDLALVRKVVGIQTAALRSVVSEEDPTFRIAVELAADTIDAVVGVSDAR